MWSFSQREKRRGGEGKEKNGGGRERGGHVLAER